MAVRTVRISDDDADARRAIGVTTVITAPAAGIFNGQSVALIYPRPEDYARAESIYDALARGQTTRRIELRRRKDGATFWSRADGRWTDARLAL